MNRHIPKKIFPHGGSKAIDLPASFVKRLATDAVWLEEKDDCLIIHPESELTAMESDPQFLAFIEGIMADALHHPDKLVDIREVWGKEWDDLLEGVEVDEDE